MALNNIRNEPHREWTEQLIGVVTIAMLLYVDYSVAKYILEPWHGKPGVPYGMGMFLTMVGFGILAPLVFLLLMGVWYALHEIGESVCGLMKSLGFDPRPRLRPKQQQVYNTETKRWTTKTVWLPSD